MGYQIEAYLDNGKPTLKIYDFEDKSPCFSWTYQEDEKEAHSRQELKRLFKALLLLTCKQEIKNVRTFNLLPREQN